MYNSSFYLNLLLLAASLFATIYGFVFIATKTKGLFFRMAVAGAGCMLAGRLSYFSMLITGHEVSMGFSVGALGAAGAYLFFLTANYGSAASLADTGDESGKYRLYALEAPAVILLEWIIVLVFGDSPEVKLFSLLMAVIIGVTVYHTFRSVIVPDVEEGFLTCIRPFNLIITVMGAGAMGERVYWSCSCLYNCSWLGYIIYGIYGACLFVMMPVLRRGWKKWMM